MKTLAHLSSASLTAVFGGAVALMLILGGTSFLVHQTLLHDITAALDHQVQIPSASGAAADGDQSQTSAGSGTADLLAHARTRTRVAAALGWGALLASLLLGASATAVGSRSFRQLGAQIRDFCRGEADLTRRLQTSGLREAAEVATCVNDFIARIQAMVEETWASASTVTDYSAQLSTAATTMAAAAEEMHAQTRSVSAASEQVSSSLNGVAAGAEQMSTVVNTVATAVEEMSSSLNEVSRSTAEASSIAGRAAGRARSTTEIMEHLNLAAGQIGNVLSTISDISDQTNLLALNATIEAASAGEAGRGFAVVANEVKELARQTAKATGEIAGQIQGMQASTGSAVQAIEEIASVIADMSTISQTIASAVEEQSSTVAEIASNISNASGAVAEVANSIQQTSVGAKEIAANIQGLSDASKEAAATTNETHAGAEELAVLVRHQKEILERFKTRQAKFDIGAVKAAHLAWRARLENALHGHRTMTAAGVASHHECQFGRWYDGVTRESFATHPAFAEVGRHHERVHQLARTILERIEAGQRDQALTNMQEFEDVRRELFASLDELYLS
jgi:methyl-accepting chemotaxis protein